MKKVLIAVSIFLTSIAAKAQVEEDYITLDAIGVEGLLVEKVTPSAEAIAADATLDGMTTYRIFVDMESNYVILGFSGLDALNIPFTFQSTSEFYNPANTGQTGRDVNAGFWSIFPNMEFDSYAADGLVGTALVGVPYSLDVTDGTVDGYTALTAETTPTTTLVLGLAHPFLTTSGETYFSDINGGWGLGSVVGATDENMPLVCQVTTAGELSFSVNLTVQDEYGNSFQIREVAYPAAENLAPEVAWINPIANIIVNKNDVVDLSVYATDDNSVASVEFFANGVSLGTVADNGNTDPTQANYILAYTAVSTVDVYAVATDDAGLETITATIAIEVTDINPTLVKVTDPAAGTYDLNNINLVAGAVDNDQPIAQVEFQVNGITVGTDTDNSDTIYSVIFQNISTVLGSAIGSPVDVVAIATNSDGEVVASTPVQVTWANGAPSVSIDEPVAPFSMDINNDTTFVATVADADGSVASVRFYVNGVLAATDADAADGFSFDYTPITPDTYDVYAIATDNLGATSTSDVISFTAVFPAGAGYAIYPVTDYCSSPSTFCVPVVTTGVIADVIGYDVELDYDATKVAPTGIVVPGEDLVADRDYVTVTTLNQIDENTVRFSVYLDGDAPEGTTFSGEGEVFCVQFTRLSTFENIDQVTFTIPLLSESYAAFVNDITDGITGTYSTISETEFNGSIAFWADNLPLNTYDLATEITPAGAASPVVVPANDGTFAWDITNGTSINIVRDIDAAESMMDVINGYDAFLTSKVTVDDESFVPTVYQIIAMDVNRDGRVAAGDITQISQRAVDQLDEFATDWLFVSSTAVLSDLSYRVSESYPANDGLGYSRLAVPSVADDIELPILDPDGCPVIDDDSYKAILLGDVNGSYANYSATASPVLKSASIANNEIVINLEKATLANEILTVPVEVSSSALLNAIDFSIDFNGSLLTFKSVVDYAGLEETVNNLGENVKLSSYSLSSISTEEPVLALQFEVEGAISSTDLYFELALLNGKAVDAEVKGEFASPSAINTGSISATSIYPNPANYELNVVFEGTADVAIVNMTGQVIDIQKDAKGSVTFDVCELPAGNYTVLVNSNAYPIVITE